MSEIDPVVSEIDPVVGDQKLLNSNNWSSNNKIKNIIDDGRGPNPIYSRTPIDFTYTITFRF